MKKLLVNAAQLDFSALGSTSSHSSVQLAPTAVVGHHFALHVHLVISALEAVTVQHLKTCNVH